MPPPKSRLAAREAGPRPSFKTVVKDYIVACLKDVLKDQPPEKKGTSILVVDSYTFKIVNTALTHVDILEAGFMSVCQLEKKKELEQGFRRAAHPRFEAVYYMKPKKANLDLVIADFKLPQIAEKPDFFDRMFPCIFRGIEAIEEEPPLYNGFRLLLVPGLQTVQDKPNWQLAYDWLNAEIESKPENARVKERWHQPEGVRECVLEAQVQESSFFSLDMESALSSMYMKGLYDSSLSKKQAKKLEAQLYSVVEQVAYRLMSVLVAANEFPYIRYVSSVRGRAEAVASELAKQMSSFSAVNEIFRPWGQPNARDFANSNGPPGAATVLIMDRVDDLAPALLHDSTYQSLMVDLMDYKPTKPISVTVPKKKGREETKEVLLNEDDPVWCLLRHDDMSDVIETVKQAVDVIKKRHTMVKSGDIDIKDMRKIISSLAYDEKAITEKFTQHLMLSHDVVGKFENLKIIDFVTIEQILVTGCDASGRTVSAKEVDNSILQVIDSPYVRSSDKIRLILLYILCSKKVTESTVKKMIKGVEMKHKVESEDIANIKVLLANLSNISVPLYRKSEERAEGAPFLDDGTIERNRSQAVASDSKICRYISKAEDLVKNIISGTLSEDLAPWIRAPPTESVDGRSAVTNDRPGGKSSSSGNQSNSTGRSNASKKSKFASDIMNSDATGNGGFESPKERSDETEKLFMRFQDPPQNKVFEGNRIFLFVLGGVTPLEMSAIDRLAKEFKREIIVGSTSLISSSDFLTELFYTNPESETLDDGALDELMKEVQIDQY